MINCFLILPSLSWEQASGFSLGVVKCQESMILKEEKIKESLRFAKRHPLLHLIGLTCCSLISLNWVWSSNTSFFYQSLKFQKPNTPQPSEMNWRKADERIDSQRQCPRDLGKAVENFIGGIGAREFIVARARSGSCMRKLHLGEEFIHGQGIQK